MNYLESKETEQTEQSSPSKDIGLVIGGLALEAIGLWGVTSFEAKTPGDAIASVDATSLGIEEQFITTADIPFIATVGVGAALIYTGIRNRLTRTSGNE